MDIQPPASLLTGTLFIRAVLMHAAAWGVGCRFAGLLGATALNQLRLDLLLREWGFGAAS